MANRETDRQTKKEKRVYNQLLTLPLLIVQMKSLIKIIYSHLTQKIVLRIFPPIVVACDARLFLSLLIYGLTRI
jgi:hypothetical protein